MSKGISSNNVLKLILVPLLVGVALKGAEMAMVTLAADEHELSISIDGPNRIIDEDGQDKLSGGTPEVMPRYAYRVNIWNSGDTAIKNVPVLLGFSHALESFRILNVRHEADPLLTFTQERLAPDTLLFSYDLLNPEDGDMINVVTTGQAELQAYSRAEGMAVQYVSPAHDKSTFPDKADFFIFGVMVTALFYEFRTIRKRGKAFEKRMADERKELDRLRDRLRGGGS